MSPVALAAKPPAAACRQGAAIRGRDARRPVPSRPLHVARAAADDDKVAAVQQALEQAKANPETADKLKLMEEAMANPAMQAQLGGMMEVMQNPAFMARMADLKEDPELKPIFEEIKGGGMPALMKYMNDPEFLGKIGAKMGDVAPAGVPTTAAAAAAAPPQEVNNILDAAKYGDLEAIEDYMAIGKGDLKDGEGRTALHYAVAYDQAPAVQALLSSGFDSNATEKDGNTALHYAAGYGRKECVGMLLAAGADVGVKNGKGQTAVDVVKGEPRNPLNQDTTLLAVLDGTAEPATINQ